jgi:hypothetical protein
MRKKVRITDAFADKLKKFTPVSPRKSSYAKKRESDLS